MTLAALADDIRAFPDALSHAALPKIGVAQRRVVLEAAQQASRGRMMGQRLDARVIDRADVVGILPVPVGPWTLLEAGSTKRQWWIPKRVGRGHKRIRIGDDVRIRVLHGPIRGKRTWTAAKAEMTQVAAKVWREEAVELWRDVG